MFRRAGASLMQIKAEVSFQSRVLPWFQLRPMREIYILFSLISPPLNSSMTLSCIEFMIAPMLVALASHRSSTFTQTSVHALPKNWSLIVKFPAIALMCICKLFGVAVFDPIQF